VISTQQLVQWLSAQCSDVVFDVGPYMPEMQDNIALITKVTGPGLNTENTFDTIGIHVAVRGPQRDIAGEGAHAETWADEIDKLFVDANYPMWVPDENGWFVNDSGRLGGQPTPMPTEDGERVVFVCTYYMNVAR
jgi:hypothetical protein